MAQHRSHTSVLVSLPQYSDITAAATVSSVSCAAGQADLGAYSAEHVYIVAASTSELIFVDPSQFYVSGGYTILRNPPSVPFTAYVVTAAYDAAFVVPDNCAGVVVENPNGQDITIQRGTANAFGYTVASYTNYLADANADGVVGFTIPANKGQFIIDGPTCRKGEAWHIVAPTSGYKAVINFL